MTLYKQTWWAQDRTIDDIEQILSKSSFYIGVVQAYFNQLIAFTRVLIDYFKFAYIYDVIVHEDFQKKGLGKN